MFIWTPCALATPMWKRHYITPQNVEEILGRGFLNPIPAGVLENQDMLGGVNLTPPPLNPMFDVQI